MKAIELNHVTMSFENQMALWDLSLEVPQGKLVAIAGPNGAGKSTLIKVILGLYPSVCGSIKVLGKSKGFRKYCAYMPQQSCVEWDFPITVQELVEMGCYQRLGLLKRFSKKDKELVQAQLAHVEMESLAERQIGALSLGQKQRAFIARSFAQQAQIYFMDEPFAGIDAVSSHVVEQVLKNEVKKGKTIFVVHHDLSSIEQLFDWVILLNRGLIACGPTKDVFTDALIAKTYGKKEELLKEILKN